MKKQKLFLLSLAVCLILSACGGGGGGDSSSSTATPVNATGAWSGPYNSSVFGAQTVTLNIMQTGSTVSGTYSSSTGGLGSISGSMDGDTAKVIIAVTTPGCSGSFNTTCIVTGNQMSFGYSGSSTCGGNESGTGNLTKQ